MCNIDIQIPLDLIFEKQINSHIVRNFRKTDNSVTSILPNT